MAAEVDCPECKMKAIAIEAVTRHVPENARTFLLLPAHARSASQTRNAALSFFYPGMRIGGISLPSQLENTPRSALNCTETGGMIQ